MNIQWNHTVSPGGVKAVVQLLRLGAVTSVTAGFFCFFLHFLSSSASVLTSCKRSSTVRSKGDSLQTSEPESGIQDRRRIKQRHHHSEGLHLSPGGGGGGGRVYWPSSLRLRSELAQLEIRLHSWMLASREAELCSWVVAQRSLVRMASSASCSTGARVAGCGQTVGRAGAMTTGAAGEVGGGGTGGGSREALPPAAAPSQCSGRGWGTVTFVWPPPPLLEPLFSSASSEVAGDWAASCRSLACDKAAWAFRAGEEGEEQDKNKSTEY